jgi:BirA family biotin operon repressor/biotin-[acetyl-CoA-carboxylase] ligase
VAREQRAGRGRRGRTWVSPPDAGLYASVIVRPFDVGDSAALALRSGMAAAQAIERLGSGSPSPSQGEAGWGFNAIHERLGGSFTQPVGIKWPNDLWIRSRKVGGILVEAAAGCAIVGIGVNVRGQANPLVRDDQARYTALDLEGVQTERDALLDALVPELDRLVPCGEALSLTPAVLEEWKGRDVLAGRRVAWTIDGEDIEGVAEGVDAAGALLLRADDGEVMAVTAGEVCLLPGGHQS